MVSSLAWCPSQRHVGGPLPARPAGERVPQLGVADRTASPAGQAGRGRRRGARTGALAAELLHLPDEPAGVEQKARESGSGENYRLSLVLAMRLCSVWSRAAR